MDFLGLFRKKDQDKSHEERVVPAKKEKRIIETVRRPKGHQIFQYDDQHDKLEIVEVKNINVDYHLVSHVKAGKKKPKELNRPHYKAWIDPRCVVFHALNIKNAERRVQRYKEGKIKVLGNLMKAMPAKIDFYQDFRI